MADHLTPEQRRKCMQGNKSENTKPEMLVRHYLFSHGFHYRLHVKNLPGKPDIVLKKYSTVIFINGCFWHGHQGCQYYRVPSTHIEFWKNKVETNQKRDEKVRRQLLEMGWAVMVIWECQLKGSIVESTMREVVYDLSKAYLKKAELKTPYRYTIDSDKDEATQAAEDSVYYNK